MARSDDDYRARILFDQSSVGQVFEASIAGADPLRAEGLELLRELAQTKAASLERERKRFDARSDGRKARRAALDRKLATSKDLDLALNLEAARARVAAPAVDDDTWVVQGRVLDGQLEGRAGLTVALFDDDACAVKGMRTDRTDRRGNFELVSRAASADSDQPAQTSGRETGFRLPPECHVRVFSADRKLLCADARPLRPRAGAADYIEIVLDAPGDFGAKV